jgi:hypothetical protein
MPCAKQDVNIAANEVEEPDDDAADVEDEDAEAAVEGAASSSGGLSGPAVQLLISTCWTSWKEASLLIGTLARRLPLPTATSSSSKGAAGRCQLLTVAQLEQLGSLQLCQLLDMKHNGAVEKSQAGFIALAARLLESPEPSLNQLPRAWLERALGRVTAQGQSRDDITRRSAGGLAGWVQHAQWCAPQASGHVWLRGGCVAACTHARLTPSLMPCLLQLL